MDNYDKLFQQLIFTKNKSQEAKKIYIDLLRLKTLKF